MEKEIVMKYANKEIKILMKDSRLAKAICEKLPFKVNVNVWGREIYFEIPVKSSITDPVIELEEGDVAYWPDGRCLCFFFGPTPASTGTKPKAAGYVEVVGRVTSDLKELEKVKSGEEVVIE
jgi:hypothetical protein